jgi:(1->4)-alpha-D-glucan 1-alpha-D-glucosylmutase
VDAESSSVAQCVDRLFLRQNQCRPSSTYRLQLHSQFRFKDALELVPYLHALGISHCYASPILTARAGSRHGYDITDHNTINPEIGTEDELRFWVSELKKRGMGLVLDTVPNHMGVGHGDNPWWQDVLCNGRSSQYAEFFDIDWEPVKTELRNKLLIPVLGNQYGTELESGHLRLRYAGGRFSVAYYDKTFPVDPQTVPVIFEPLGDLRAYSGAELPESERTEFENILWHLRQMPPHGTVKPEEVELRRRQIAELQRRFDELVSRSGGVRHLVEAAVKICNGEVGNARSFDAMHRLLEAQAYRLAHWRVSAQEINYRRFFDVNDLIGLRMENPRVFAATHRLIRRLMADGTISGLRIDHPDGLLNPVQYFTRVQMLYAASQCCGPEPSGPLAENGIEIEVQDTFGQREWANRIEPLYLVAEKILEHGEHLPPDWPVSGTVGYDFANLVNGLFIDQRNVRFFTNLYRRFIGGPLDIDTLIYEAKKLIMETSLSSEVTVLSHMLEEIASTDRHARDFTRYSLTEAIRETIACFPVYRTYTDERGNVIDRDRRYISEAILRAKRRNPSTSTDLFDFLRDILLINVPPLLPSEEYRKRLNFVLKFQQLTGPVMAKGLEDTVCYVYNRFVSVNEVGGSPAQFGISEQEFHDGNLERSRFWPVSMLATSTHDSKRSEDVRARLDVLSEMPRVWAAHVIRWKRYNRSKKRTIADSRTVPDANEEYLLYQTLAGAWPMEMDTDAQRQEFTQRIQAYMTKAVHEAKVNLSWVNPNPEYVQALAKFIDRILRPGTASRPNRFLESTRDFMPIISFFGALTSIVQVLLKLTVPGVPDIYQGCELWDFSLVDPDNRRPVDFHVRTQLLEHVRQVRNDADCATFSRDLIEHFQDGRIKLWTTMRGLTFRREHPQLFECGSYLPLQTVGTAHHHVVAFARHHNNDFCVVAVPRFPYTLMKGRVAAPLGDVWGETTISVPYHRSAELRNILTGEVLHCSSEGHLSCSEVFANFPAALLAPC